MRKEIKENMRKILADKALMEYLRRRRNNEGKKTITLDGIDILDFYRPK